MTIITTQMLRDKLAFEGPKAYSDLLGLADDSQAREMLDKAIEQGLGNGVIRIRFEHAEPGFGSAVFYTNWRE